MCVCPKCGSNNAFEATDINWNRQVLVCPDCRSVSWPVPTTECLERDLKRIQERIGTISYMPETEDQE